MQRKLERSIRKCKREITVREAAGDEEKLKIARVRYTRLNQEYARFSKAAGLRTQTERLHTAGFDYKQGAKATTETNKKFEEILEKARNGDTIILDEDMEAFIAGKPFAEIQDLRGKLYKILMNCWLTK